MNMKKKIKLLAKLISLLVVILLASCETNKIKSASQLLESEYELLDEFLSNVESENNPDGLTNRERLIHTAVDTLDHSKESGLLYFETVTGVGNPPTVGMEVGYRYNLYIISRDTAQVPRALISSTNYFDVNPTSFTIGGSTASSLSSKGIYPGITEAILNMRLYGKSTIIVPSPIGRGDYVSRMYELEITYMSK